MPDPNKQPGVQGPLDGIFNEEALTHPAIQGQIQVTPDKEMFIDYSTAHESGITDIGLFSGVVFAKNKGVDIKVVMPSEDEYFAKKSIMTGLNQMPDKVPIMMGGKPMTDINGNLVFQDNEDKKNLAMKIHNDYNDLTKNYYNYQDNKHVSDITDVRKYAKGEIMFGLDPNNDDFGTQAKRSVGIVEGVSDYRDMFQDKSDEEYYTKIKGTYFDETDGQYKEYDGSGSFWRDLSYVLINQVFGDAKVFFGIPITHLLWDRDAGKAIVGMPKKMYIKYDENGQKQAYMNYADKIESPFSIISAFGPQKKSSGFFSEFVKGLESFLPTIAQIGPTITQTAYDAWGWITGNDMTDEAGYHQALAVQNIIGSYKIKQSEKVMGDMWSAGGVGYMIGSVIPQIAAVVLTSGAGAPALARTLVSLASLPTFNEVGREMGVDRRHMVLAMPAVFGINYGSEMLGANWLYKSAAKIGTNKGAKAAIEHMLQNVGGSLKNTTGKGSTSFFRGIYNTSRGLEARALPKAVAIIAEEGLEEVPATLGENLTQIISDYVTMEREVVAARDGIVFGEGLFNSYSINSEGNLFDMAKEHVTEGLGAAFVGGIFGGFSGIPMQKLSMKYLFKSQFNEAEQSIIEHYVNGTTGFLRNTIETFRKDRKFTTPGFDKDGKPITINGKEVDVNDFIADQLLAQIDAVEAVGNAFFTKDNVQAMGGNKIIASDALKQLLNAQAIKKQVDELSATPQDKMTPEIEAKIKELSEAYNTAIKDVNEWITPDTENGSKHSKGYNAYMRNMVSHFGYAKMMADNDYFRKHGKQVTNRQRAGKEYTQMLMYYSQGFNGGGFIRSNNLFTTTDKRQGALKNRTEADIKGDATQTIENMDKVLGALTTALTESKEGNTKAAVSKMMSELNSAFESVLDVDAVNLSGDQSMMNRFGQQLNKITKISNELNKIINSEQLRDGTVGDYVKLLGQYQSLSSLETRSKKQNNKLSSVERSLDKYTGKNMPESTETFGGRYKYTADYNFNEEEKAMIAATHVGTAFGNETTYSASAREAVSRGDKIKQIKADIEEIEDTLKKDAEDGNKMSDQDKVNLINKLQELSIRQRVLETIPLRGNYSQYSEQERYYFADIVEEVLALEDAMRKGFKNVNREVMDEHGNARYVELNEEYVLQRYQELMDDLRLRLKAGQHDLAMTEFLKSHPNEKASYDHPIEQSEFESLFSIGGLYSELIDKLTEVSDAAGAVFGVSKEHISYAFHLRARMMGLRFMLDARKDPNGTESPFIKKLRDAFDKAKASEDFNRLMDISRNIQQDENGKSKYDLSTTEVRKPGSLLTQDKIALTLELEKLVVEAETIINKHRDVFFSKENVGTMVESFLWSIHFMGANGIAAYNDDFSANRVGYLKAEFVSNFGAIKGSELQSVSSFEYLANMVGVNMSGEASIIHDPTKHTVIPNTGNTAETDNSSKRIMSSRQSAFNYKYVINYMMTLYGTNSSENIQRYLGEANGQGAFATYEQFINQNFINAVLNGDNSKFFDSLLNIEQESLKKLINANATEEDKKPNSKNTNSISNLDKALGNVNTMNDDYISGAVLATGDYSTGKSMFMIPSAIRSYYGQLLKDGKPVRISLVTNTTALRGQIEKMIKTEFGTQVSIDFFDTHGENGILKKGVLPNGQLVIWDEASLIDSSIAEDKSMVRDQQIKSLKTALNGNKALLLGDYSQMVNRRSVGGAVFNSVPSTYSLNRRFASGYNVLIQLADFFRDNISYAGNGSKLIQYAYKSLSDGTLIGSQYTESISNVMKSFVDDKTKGSSLLILQSREWVSSNMDLLEKMGIAVDGKIKQEYLDPDSTKRVHVIEEDIVETVPFGMLESVQGLRSDKVYVAIDYIGLAKEELLGPSYAARAMYTAVGRANNYVMIVGNSNHKITSPRNVEIALKPRQGTEGLDKHLAVQYFGGILNGIVDVDGKVNFQQKPGESSVLRYTAMATKLMEDGFVGYPDKDGNMRFYKKQGKHIVTKLIEKDTVVGSRRDFGITTSKKSKKGKTMKLGITVYYDATGDNIDSIAIYNGEANKTTFSGKEITDEMRSFVGSLVAGKDNPMPKEFIKAEPTFSNYSQEDKTFPTDYFTNTSPHASNVIAYIEDNYKTHAAMGRDDSIDQNLVIHYSPNHGWYIENEQGEIDHITADVAKGYVQSFMTSTTEKMSNPLILNKSKVADSGVNIAAQPVNQEPVGDIVQYDRYSVTGRPNIVEGALYRYNGQEVYVTSITSVNGVVSVGIVSSDGTTKLASPILTLSQVQNLIPVMPNEDTILTDEDGNPNVSKFEKMNIRKRTGLKKSNPSSIFMYSHMSTVVSTGFFKSVHTTDRQANEALKSKLAEATRNIKMKLFGQEVSGYSFGVYYNDGVSHWNNGELADTHTNMGKFSVRITGHNGNSAEDIVKTQLKKDVTRILNSYDASLVDHVDTIVENIFHTVMSMENIPFQGNVSFYSGNTLRNLEDILGSIDEIKYASDDETPNVLKDFVRRVYPSMPAERTSKDENIAMGIPITIDKANINKNHWLDGGPNVRNSVSGLMANMKARGLKTRGLTMNLVPSKGGANAAKVVLTFDSFYGTSGQIYLMPKQIDEQYMDEAINELEAFLKKKYDDVVQYNRDFNRLKIVELINGNKSAIMRDASILSFVSEYFELKSNASKVSVKYDGKDIVKGEKDTLRKMHDALIADKKGNRTKIDALRTLRFPVRGDALPKTMDAIDRMFDVNVDNVDMPGLYVNLGNGNPSNKSTDYDDIADSILRGNNANDDDDAYADSIESKQVYWKAVRDFDSIWQRMLGANWSEVVEFCGYGSLIHNGKVAYGLYKNRKIYMSVKDGMVKNTTPRHEIFHFIEQNFVSKEARQKLFTEARTRMAAEIGSMAELATDDQVREWLAEEFSNYDVQDNRRGTILGRMIQRAFNFFNALFGLYNDSTIDGIFNKIERGGYVKSVQSLIDNGMIGTDDNSIYPDQAEKINSKTFDYNDRKVRTRRFIINSLNKSVDAHDKITKRVLNEILENSIFKGGIKSIPDAINTLFAERDAYLKQMDNQYEVLGNTKYYYTRKKVTTGTGKNKKREYRKTIDINIALKLYETNPGFIKKWADHVMYTNIQYFIDLSFRNAYKAKLGRSGDGNNQIDNWSRKNSEVSVDETYGGVFKLWLSSMEYKEDGATVQRFSFGDMNNLLKEVSVEVEQEVRNNEYMSLFLTKLEKRAKSNYLAPVVARQASALLDGVNQLYNVMSHPNNYDKKAVADAKDMLIKLISIIKTSHKQTLYKGFYVDGKLIHKQLFSNSMMSIKYNTIDKVNRRLFDKNGLLAKKYVDMFTGTHLRFRVDGNGVYMPALANSMGMAHPLIVRENGRFVFNGISKIDTTTSRELQKILRDMGINMSPHVIENILQKGSNKDVNERIMGYHAFGSDNTTENIFAEFIWGIMASMQQWANFTSEMYKTVDYGDLDPYQMTEEEKAPYIQKNEERKKQLTKQFVTLGTNEVLDAGLEGLLEKMRSSSDKLDQMSRQQVENETDVETQEIINANSKKTGEDASIRYYTPTSFYAFYEMLAAVEAFDKSREHSPFAYNDMGTKFPHIVYKNYLFRMLQKGINTMKELIEDSKTDGRNIYEDTNGYRNILNPLVRDEGLSIYVVGQETSFKDNVAAEDLHPADVARVSVDMFVESILNYKPKFGVNSSYGYNSLIFEFADKLDIYNMSMTSDKLYFNIIDKNGKLNVTKDTKNIVQAFRDMLEYHHNGAILSAYRWKDALEEVGKMAGVNLRIDVNRNDPTGSALEAINALSKLNDPKIIALLKTKLWSTVDYNIEEKNGVKRIVPGKALLFNDKIWSKEHYVNLNKMVNEQKSNDDMFDYIMQNILRNNYIEFSQVMSKMGYEVPSKYRNVEGYDEKMPPYYYIENNEMVFNPIMFAFFTMDILTRSMIDSTYLGDAMSFNTLEEKVKRSKSALTGYISPGITGDGSEFNRGTIRKDINVIIVNDKEGSYEINGKKYKTKIGDGQGRVGIVFEKYMRSTYGGTFSVHGDGAAKTIGMSNDVANGYVTQIKYSQDPTTAQLYEKFPAYRDMEHAILDAWSQKVNDILLERGDNDTIDLREKFIEFYDETGSADTAATMLRDWIGNSIHVDIIEQNIFAGFFNRSTVKTTSKGLIDLSIDDVNAIEDYYGGYPHITISAEDYGIITNLSQDTENGLNNLAWSSQLASTLSQFENSTGRPYADRMKSVRKTLTDAGRNRMLEEFNKLKKEHPEWSDTRLMHAFFRDIAEDVFEVLGDDSELKNILSNRRINLNQPSIERKLTSIFNSYINKHTVAPRTNGYRGTAVSGDMITLYKLKGTYVDGKLVESDEGDVVYSINRLEDKHGVYYDEDMKSGNTIRMGDEVYEVVKLKAMHWDENDNMVPGTVAMRNPVMEEYSMTPEEDVSDVYTIDYVTKKGESKRSVFGDKGVTRQEKDDNSLKRAQLIADLVIGHFEGKVSIKGLESLLSEDGNKMDANVIFRVLEDEIHMVADYYSGNTIGGAINEEFSKAVRATLEKAIKEFFEDFEYITTIAYDRVPHGHQGQGSIVRAISFINDTQNNIYKDMSDSVLSDEDNDGDQANIMLRFSRYKEFKMGENVEKLQMVDDGNMNSMGHELMHAYANNQYVDIFVEAYSDKLNKKHIAIASDVKKIEEEIRSKTSKRVRPAMSSFAAALESYAIGKAGKESIEIFAAAVSAFGEMMSLDHSFLKERVKFLSPKIFAKVGTKEGYDKQVSRLLGDWLQVALNNANNGTLGLLGVPSAATPLIVSFILGYNGKAKTMDELSSEIIDFFNQKIVRDALSKLAMQGRIGEYEMISSMTNLFKDMYENAKTEAKGITVAQYEKAKQQSDTFAQEVKDKMKNLEKILTERKAKQAYVAFKQNILDPSFIHDLEEATKMMNDEERNMHIRDIVFEHVENLQNKSFTKEYVKGLFKKFGETEVNEIFVALDKVMDSVRESSQKLNDYKAIVKAYEKSNVYGQLYNMAVHAEAMRRFSSIIGLRKGIEGNHIDYTSKRNEYELYLGMSLDRFFTQYDGRKVISADEKVDFAMSRNNRYLTTEESEELDKLRTINKDIYNAIDIERLLKSDSRTGMEYFLDALEYYKNRYKDFGMNDDDVFVRNHRVFKDAKQRIMAELYRGKFSATQEVEFDNTITDVMIDGYYKYNKRHHNISSYNIIDSNDGIRSIGAEKYMFLGDVDLSSRKGRHFFYQYFTEYFKFIKDLADSNFSDAIHDEINTDYTYFFPDGMNKAEMDRIKNHVKAFRTNGFIGRYTTSNQSGEYLSFDSSNNLSIDEKNALQDEFKLMPEDLQRMFFDYETIRNAFSFRKGSGYDALPLSTFEEYSKFIQDFGSQLDAWNNDKDTRENFIQLFTEAYTSKMSVLTNVGSPKHVSARRSLVDKRQVNVLPGDGSNKTGITKVGVRRTEINKDSNSSYFIKSIQKYFNDGTMSKRITPLFGYRGIDLISLYNPNAPVARTYTEQVVTHVLDSDKMAQLHQAAIDGRDAEVFYFKSGGAKYDYNPFYTTELGDIVTFVKTDETGEMWKVKLMTNYNSESMQTYKEGQLTEEIDDNLIRQDRYEKEGFGVKAVRAIDSESSLMTVANVIKSSNMSSMVVVFGTDDKGLHRGYTARLLDHGTKGWVHDAVKRNDYIEDGKVGTIMTGSKSTVDGIYSYGMEIRKATEKNGKVEYSYDYTMEELKNRIKDIYILANANKDKGFVFTMDKLTGIKINGTELSRAELAGIFGDVFMEMQQNNTAPRNVFFAGGYALDINRHMDPKANEKLSDDLKAICKQ